jgi:hypothetical protein
MGGREGSEKAVCWTVAAVEVDAVAVCGFRRSGISGTDGDMRYRATVPRPWNAPPTRPDAAEEEETTWIADRTRMVPNKDRAERCISAPGVPGDVQPAPQVAGEDLETEHHASDDQEK